MKKLSTAFRAWAGLTAALYWLWGLVYFPTLLPDYQAISQTISELGAFSTPLANRVNYAWSLPLGLLQCWAVFGERRQRDLPDDVRNGLVGLGCVGIAYATGALFPCDPGSPLWGSWRQLLHNLFGSLEYLGGGIGLLLLAASRRNQRPLAIALQWSGITVLAALLLMTIPQLFCIRGAVQRIADILLFGWLAWACGLRARGVLLWKTPDQR